MATTAMENKSSLRTAAAAATLFLVLLCAGELAAAAAMSRPCNMDEKGLIACLPAITVGVSPAKAKPSAACCAALGKADMPCLCKFKSDPSLPQLGIDPKLAVKLPGQCKLRVPKNCY